MLCVIDISTLNKTYLNLILTNAVNIKWHFTCKYCTKHLDNSLTDQ